MLCNNSSQEHYCLRQIWEVNLLFFLNPEKALLCCYRHTSLNTIYYRQGKHRGHRAAGQANPARLSVCKSLAPSRCRLSKHTNITTAIKVARLPRLRWRILKAWPYKAAPVFSMDKYVLKTLSTQDLLRVEKAFSFFIFHHHPGKRLWIDSMTLSQSTGMVLQAIGDTAEYWPCNFLWCWISPFMPHRTEMN